MKLLLILVVCAQAFAVDKMLDASHGSVTETGSHSTEQPHNDKNPHGDSHQHQQPAGNNKDQISNHVTQVMKQQKTSQGPLHPTSAGQVSHKPTVQHLQQQHVEQVAQVAQTHIPQVISHHISQQKQEQAKPGQPTKLRASRAVHHHVPHKYSPHGHKHHPHVARPHVSHHNRGRSKRATASAHAQHLAQQVHQHVPYVIQHHVQQHHHKNHGLEKPRKCDFGCTDLDLSVCATNGKCWMEFESLCHMSNWNCLHTQKVFAQVSGAECMDTAKPKCYPGDMLN